MNRAPGVFRDALELGPVRSAIGAVIAPPLIALIVSMLGWRWVFYLTGGLGFLWAWLWLKIYSPPATSRFILTEERRMIESARSELEAR